ncbi:hypothetical protein B0H13DRAFT_1877267 [Mycena leptocephala]|nr:hypothetical protein B0H13DRAFT_1877267 [Mycena leptocephala]
MLMRYLGGGVGHYHVVEAPDEDADEPNLHDDDEDPDPDPASQDSDLDEELDGEHGEDSKRDSDTESDSEEEEEEEDEEEEEELGPEDGEDGVDDLAAQLEIYLSYNSYNFLFWSRSAAKSNTNLGKPNTSSMQALQIHRRHCVAFAELYQHGDALAMLDIATITGDQHDLPLLVMHGAALITAWELIVKDGTAGEWPGPPLSSDARSTPGNALSQLDGPSRRDAERLRRALEDSGVLPADGEVGPVRHAKSIYARRIEKLKNAAKGRNGRKRDFLADECVIPGTASVTRKDGTTKEDPCTWCIACDKKTAGHDPVRIKTHAHQCQTLQAKYHDLWVLVDHERGGSSLSTALEEGNSSALPAVRKAVETPASQAIPNPATSTPGASQGIREYFTPTKIRRERQAQIDLLLFKSIICCAIPFSLLGSPFFIEFVLALAPNYKVPERSAFFARHITSKVAAVGQKLKAFLSTKTHMTFSLDGWSTRHKDEIYTCHSTIPSRRSFFVGGHVFKGVSITGEALCNVVKGILETFDPRKYSAIAGDGGPNDLGALFKKDCPSEWWCPIDRLITVVYNPVIYSGAH